MPAAWKSRTAATNRWLGENLNLGAMHEVTRKVNLWIKSPDLRLARKLTLTTKVDSVISPLRFRSLNYRPKRTTFPVPRSITLRQESRTVFDDVFVSKNTSAEPALKRRTSLSAI